MADKKISKQKVIDSLREDPQMPLRHSAEHILHKAMEILYPGLKRVMGPPIENGFYFDFDYDQSISQDDFPKIEELMQKIIDADLKFKKLDTNYADAREIFKDNQYKQDLINEIEERGEEVTLYEMGKKGEQYYDIDLCAGPHSKSTGQVKAFKLLSVAGAYYKGDEKNKMLQRIYGTAFDSQENLNKYLEVLENARKNDHRELNKVLDIFAQSDLVGKGLVMYTPNGTIIRNALRDHLMEICTRYGAQQVDIPHMAKIDLYKISGHAEKFEDELFKVTSHYDEEFVLKPVNCPHHTQIYASRPRSYRDLPIAYVESTQQHRDEKPGAMVALNRARSFEVDDGHTFCTPDQIKGEAIKMINIIKEFYSSLGMWGNHWVSLSLRNPETPEKYIGDEEGWEKAEAMLLEINNELNLGGKIMIGEAALYGPKIDIMLKDVLGNDRQLGTVQIDFAMPARFGLVYTDKDGSEKTPAMLHRAILGSYHRFIAYLLESTGGALPLWLSPIQVAVIPVSEKNLEYSLKVKEALKKEKVRAEVFDRDDTMQNKIRQAQNQKVPYMLVLGGREEESGTVSVRLRTGEKVDSVNLKEFVQRVVDRIVSKAQI